MLPVIVVAHALFTSVLEACALFTSLMALMSFMPLLSFMPLVPLFTGMVFMPIAVVPVSVPSALIFVFFVLGISVMVVLCESRHGSSDAKRQNRGKTQSNQFHWLLLRHT